MRGARAFAAALLYPCAVALAQTTTPPTASAAASASLVIPADEHTKTAAGGSFELELSISRSFSAGVIAGFWSGESDFDKNSTENYFGGVLTHRWGAGRIRPFLQIGGGLYFVKLQFQSRNRFAPRDKDTVGGGFAGPGLDYMLSSNSAVEVRARYHLVSDVSGVHTDFLETQLGLRFFF
jgi:hypothetical protein